LFEIASDGGVFSLYAVPLLPATGRFLPRKGTQDPVVD